MLFVLNILEEKHTKKGLLVYKLYDCLNCLFKRLSATCQKESRYYFENVLGAEASYKL